MNRIFYKRIVMVFFAAVLTTTLSSCDDFWEHVVAGLEQAEFNYNNAYQGYGTPSNYIYRPGVRGAALRDAPYTAPATRGLSVESQSFLKSIEKVNLIELNTQDPEAMLAIRNETEKQADNKRGIELLHCNEDNLCAFGRVKKGIVTDVSITGLIDGNYVVTAVHGSFNLEELRLLAAGGELFNLLDYIHGGAQQ